MRRIWGGLQEEVEKERVKNGRKQEEEVQEGEIQKYMTTLVGKKEIKMYALTRLSPEKDYREDQLVLEAIVVLMRLKLLKYTTQKTYFSHLIKSVSIIHTNLNNNAIIIAVRAWLKNKALRQQKNKANPLSWETVKKQAQGPMGSIVIKVFVLCARLADMPKYSVIKKKKESILLKLTNAKVPDGRTILMTWKELDMMYGRDAKTILKVFPTTGPITNAEEMTRLEEWLKENKMRKHGYRRGGAQHALLHGMTRDQIIRLTLHKNDLTLDNYLS